MFKIYYCQVRLDDTYKNCGPMFIFIISNVITICKRDCGINCLTGIVANSPWLEI